MTHFKNETERINAYINGTMTQEEETKFMQDCVDNPNLHYQLSRAGMLLKALQQ